MSQTQKVQSLLPKRKNREAGSLFVFIRFVLRCVHEVQTVLS